MGSEFPLEQRGGRGGVRARVPGRRAGQGGFSPRLTSPGHRASARNDRLSERRSLSNEPLNPFSVVSSQKNALWLKNTSTKPLGSGTVLITANQQAGLNEDGPRSQRRLTEPPPQGPKGRPRRVLLPEQAAPCGDLSSGAAARSQRCWSPH